MTDSTDNDHADATPSSLEWGTTSFVPGTHVGLVARNTIGLIARENPSTREQLWALVSSDAPIDDILEELSSTGLKSLPDFALAQVEGDNVRVVARGSASVSAESATGSSRSIDASDVRTWVEDVVAGVVSVTVSLADDGTDAGEADGGGFAVLAGSVPAASMTRRFDTADAFAVDADAWVSVDAAAPAATTAVDDTDQAEPNLAEAPDVDLELAPVDEPDAPADPDPFAPSDEAPVAPESAPEAEPEPEPESVFAPEPEPEADPEPESVFAPEPEPEPEPEPMLEPVEAVASSPQPTMDPSGALLQPAEPQPAPPQPPPPVVTGAEAMGPGPSGPPEVESSGAMPPIDDPERPAPFDVQADLEQSLEVDDAGFVPGEPQVIGVLAFSNGERIDVDRSILIGRNPKVTGTVDGPLPHIMKYEGPGQGLSRTHAEVRIEEGQLVLEDLRSTNGTDVQLPGQQRRRLLGGEPVVVVPGTLIDFGEELHCTVETAH